MTEMCLGVGLEALFAERRRLAVQRFLFAFLLLLGGVLAWRAILPWIWAYLLGQVLEYAVFTPARSAAFARSRLGRAAMHLMIAVDGATFGALALLAGLSQGAMGLACSGLFLSTVIIRTVMTMQRSRSAFLAYFLPLGAGLAALPVVALGRGASWPAVAALAVGGISVGVTALVLWKDAMAMRASERAAQAEAERRRAEAESAVAAKSAFVALVSHELRTPITAIMAGAAEIERTGEGVERANARLIREAGAMMRTLLNDLLDLAKLDAGKMPVERIRYDLRRLLADQMRFWRAEAREKQIRLRLEGARRAPAFVVSDPTRLRQILNNLLSNAFKFTDEGSVTVSLDCVMADQGRRRLTIAIRDTGPGMEAEQIARLFAPFSQGGDSVARTHGGTGLGLTISRELAQLMGGDISVESAPGCGATFALRLDVEEASSAEPPDPAPTVGIQAQETGLRVLLVDDHEINRRAVSLMLGPLGARVTTCASGLEALETAAVDHFDIILMDLHLPDLDGREVSRRLRSDPGPNRRTPVIAVTGAVGAEEAASCLAAGMNDCVAKPVDIHELFAAIARRCAEPDSAQACA